MRFDVEVRLFQAMRGRFAISLEIDDGNEKPGIDWLRLNLVSWREPIEQLRQRRVEHQVRDQDNRSQKNLISDKSLIALNIIVMNKFILLLAAVFSLGVVAQAADPTPSPSASASASASGSPKKHHHHHKAAPASPSAKPSASPKA